MLVDAAVLDADAPFLQIGRAGVPVGHRSTAGVRGPWQRTDTQAGGDGTDNAVGGGVYVCVAKLFNNQKLLGLRRDAEDPHPSPKLGFRRGVPEVEVVPRSLQEEGWRVGWAGVVASSARSQFRPPLNHLDPFLLSPQPSWRGWGRDDRAPARSRESFSS